MKTLREIAKSKKKTSRALAKNLNVSEVTIKRWFTGHTCSLENVFAICETLEISFFDLVSLAKKDEEVDHFLTPEQEKLFATQPALFGIFKQLHKGESVAEVAAKWNLSMPKFYKILRSFEKQALLDVLPDNKIRFKVRGNIRYQHQGLLAKKILRPQIIQFLNHVDDTLEHDDVCMHSAEVELSEAHLEELVGEIHALGAKYRARAYRDHSLLPTGKLRPVRWLLALAPYQTDWRQYEEGLK